MNPIIWLPVALVILLAVGMVIARRHAPSGAHPADERVGQLLAAGLLPLAECPRGRDACLRCLLVERCVVHRLLELGLTPGTELRIVQDSGGPVVVSVRGSRVALGRDLAEQLWVELPPSVALSPAS